MLIQETSLYWIFGKLNTILSSSLFQRPEINWFYTSTYGLAGIQILTNVPYDQQIPNINNSKTQLVHNYIKASSLKWGWYYHWHKWYYILRRTDWFPFLCCVVYFILFIKKVTNIQNRVLTEQCWKPVIQLQLYITSTINIISFWYKVKKKQFVIRCWSSYLF